ncbi:hypothetical protein SPBR_04601 [Sporothrix brasiliensis 5110]|uniref:Sodium/calcium exchanger membrane region domain-containing protein n=1 Tax=Sporothrix brasiliensis 5110 TaxID=1398154 RepID=A0A0C2F9A5_9PEZI|nr:uncharacterized protein SPBR_04601 [Sporothrix brasiliensis 5110]KIH87633.1 hypothetical protein SPBR_04601 [Sporothrix brasiliensis 5110]
MTSLPTTPRRRRARFRTRPFYISTGLILALVAFHTFMPGVIGPSKLDNSISLVRRDDGNATEDLECRLVHQAADQCAFVLANCEDEAAGLIPYITFYYCSMQHVQPLAFTILVIWLGLLFTTIGIAASDFFSVNLSTISTILGLSESLAGVTFLAFGNGSPDVFSTFAAMGSNSGSMAVGELIGAAGFITGVVAGSMALVREFKVSRRTFVRDIAFFIMSVAFSMVFLADGKLMLWECCVMIGFYLFYVLTVVGWHWVSTRRKRQRAREAASRGHYYGATIGTAGQSGAGDDDLAPYHDDDNRSRPNAIANAQDGLPIDPHDEPEPDDTAPVGRRERPPPDISALERGPRIEVDSVDNPGEADLAFNMEAQADQISEEEQDRRNRHITAEMTSSMRVSRPAGRRRTTTTTPIRPSLLGALEFRSVLASLQRSGTMHLDPIDRRRMTSQHRPSLSRGHSVSVLNGTSTLDGHSREDDMSRSSLLPQDAYRRGSTGARDRAWSSGNRPFSWTDSSHQLGPPLLRFTDAGDTVHEEDAAAAAASSLGPSPLGGSEATSGLASPENGDDEDEDEDEDIDSEYALHETLEADGANASREPLMNGHRVSVGAASTPTLNVTRPETEWQRYRRSTLTNRPLQSPVVRTIQAEHGVDASNISSTAVSMASAASSSAPPPEHVPAIPTTLSNPPAKSSEPAILGSELRQAEAEAVAAGWNRWLVTVQLFAGPLFTAFIVWANISEDLENPWRSLLFMIVGSLGASSLMLVVLLAVTSATRRPKYHSLLCFLGFIISVAWISTVAGEVVGVLKAFGVIVGISEAILGLTIFAVGNSLGDLVADITVARLGYPVMALSACFGGPMLNILLGVGVGGAWMTIKAAKAHRDRHPDQPLHYKPYIIQVGSSLMVSAVTVLITLFVLLVAVPANRWVMSRKIGLALIGLWTVSTIVNVVLEVTGAWR